MVIKHGLDVEERYAPNMPNILIWLFLEVESLHATLPSAPRKPRNKCGLGGVLSQSVANVSYAQCIAVVKVSSKKDKDIEDLNLKSNSSLCDQYR
jgi:hypothetical protein